MQSVSSTELTCIQAKPSQDDMATLSRKMVSVIVRSQRPIRAALSALCTLQSIVSQLVGRDYSTVILLLL